MRTVVCPGCQQSVPVPEDLRKAHCVRCGQAFALETGITTEPVLIDMSSAQRDLFADRLVAEVVSTQVAMPDRWSSWDEFRSNSRAVQRELMQLVARPLPDLRGLIVHRLPGESPESLDDWSTPLGTIRIPGSKHGTTIARKMLGWLFLTGGLILVCLGALELLIDAIGNETGAMALGYGFFAFLLASLVWYIPNPKLAATMWIFEEGIYVYRYGQSRMATWEEIQDFEISMSTGRPLYWVTLSHDLTVTISAGFAPEVVSLMEYMEIRVAAAQLLRRLEAIWEGHAQRFDIVALDRRGIHASEFFAPWSEIRRVISDGHILFVDWAGEAEPMPLRYSDVSFPYLVLAIAHVMIEEHRRFPENG